MEWAYKSRRNVILGYDHFPGRRKLEWNLPTIGYKFETLSTLPRIWAECSREEIEGRNDEVVNQEPQYCSVVQTGFGKTKLLIGGEVDAGKIYPLS